MSNLKQIIRKILPVALRRIIQSRLQERSYKDLTTQQIFTKIYKENSWGKADEPGQEYYSGSGSHDPSIVDLYVASVKRVFSSLPAKPDVVDLGCGDFHVGSQLRSACNNYVACDVVEPLISHNRQRFESFDVDFRVLDLASDELPFGEVVFIRQVFQHLSNSQILNALSKITKTYKYIVLTEHIPASPDFKANLDKPPGVNVRLGIDSGVVLEAAPFNLKSKYSKVLCEVPEFGGVIKTTYYHI